MRLLGEVFGRCIGNYYAYFEELADFRETQRDLDAQNLVAVALS